MGSREMADWRGVFGARDLAQATTNPDLAMTLQTAAERLLSTLNLPPGTVNVLPVHADEGDRLVIWIDSQYLLRMRDFPSCYEGYTVSIEARPEISAH